jgi:hypothetical protein
MEVQMRAVWDIDFCIFDAVSVAEEKFITATHMPTGKVIELDNQSALWGDWRKKDGGWIGIQNKLAGNDFYKAEDFTVVPGHRPRPFKTRLEDEEGNIVVGEMSPFEGARKILDDKIKSVHKQLGITSYVCYTGRGEVFRHDKATLLPYKGQREDMLRPLLLDRMKDYVVEHHNGILVTGPAETNIEADDAVSMATVAGYDAWKKGGKKDEDRVIAIAVDKDGKQTNGWHFNPTKDTEPRLIEGFGSLWLDEKGNVDGAGRMWLYYQITAGDSADNYKSNCFSDVSYASKGAYKDLKDCKNDKEAFEAMVRVFKKLYPKEKVVEGCKGPVKIDWLYVMQEMATMALMLRKPGDKLDVKATLDKLEIKYD